MDLVKKDNGAVLTKEQLQASMPKKFRHNVTDEMIDFINSTEGDEFRDIYKENLVGFADVIESGRYKMLD